MQQMILAKTSKIRGDVAVTDGNDVAFEFDADQETLGDPVPPGCKITGIEVTPHDAADPKVAVSTIWRLRLYSTYAKLVGDQVYEDTRYAAPTSSEVSLDRTPWDYRNEDGVGSIYGTIGIDTGATDCSFTIAITFERR